MKGLFLLGCAALSASVAFAQFTQIKIESLVNTATMQPGLPGGGALATFFVSGLNAQRLDAYPGTYVASGIPLPSILGGAEVLVCGFNAPILSVYVPASGSSDYARVDFQVPLERNVLREVSATASVCGPGAGVVFRSPTGTTTGAAVSPLPLSSYGGFFVDANKYVIAQHASDYSPVTTGNPAHAGEAIIAYADDLLLSLWPEAPMGIPAPLDVPIRGNIAGSYQLYLQTYPTPTPILFGIGGYLIPNTPPLLVTFLGLAPGQIGVQQVNFIVPANQQPGDWSLFFADGLTNATANVLLPVR
jgi:uncharacterized protein (TIGR03437 family)